LIDYLINILYYRYIESYKDKLDELLGL